MDDFLTVQQAANALHTTREIIHGMIDNGRLAAIELKPGSIRTRRIRRTDIDTLAVEVAR